jgi:hypothetical protein
MGVWKDLYTFRRPPVRPPVTRPPLLPAAERDAAERGVLKALGPWRQAQTRAAWRPQAEDGAGAPTGSRFGGLP